MAVELQHLEPLLIERINGYFGFKAISQALQIRPNNLTGGVATCRERLEALGFAPAPMVFRISAFDEACELRARNLWEVDRLVADYVATRERLAAPERA